MYTLIELISFHCRTVVH